MKGYETYEINISLIVLSLSESFLDYQTRLHSLKRKLMETSELTYLKAKRDNASSSFGNKSDIVSKTNQSLKNSSLNLHVPGKKKSPIP